MKKYCTSVNTIQEHTTATILLYATPFSQFINSPSRTDLYLLVLEKIFCETVLHWGAGLAACKPRSVHCKFYKLRPPRNFASLQEPQREKRLTDLTDFQVVFEETACNFKRPYMKEKGVMSDSQPYSWNLNLTNNVENPSFYSLTSV